jgi:uncharacterized protein YfaS (alpha-2-macroglobulin family)
VAVAVTHLALVVRQRQVAVQVVADSKTEPQALSTLAVAVVVLLLQAVACPSVVKVVLE